jgi:hypothetical protein
VISGTFFVNISLKITFYLKTIAFSKIAPDYEGYEYKL